MPGCWVLDDCIIRTSCCIMCNSCDLAAVYMGAELLSRVCITITLLDSEYDVISISDLVLKVNFIHSSVNLDAGWTGSVSAHATR